MALPRLSRNHYDIITPSLPYQRFLSNDFTPMQPEVVGNPLGKPMLPDRATISRRDCGETVAPAMRRTQRSHAKFALVADRDPCHPALRRCNPASAHVLGPHAMNAAELANLSQDQLIAIIQQLANASRTKLTLKVSEKGALSCYGMGRWPVTLYKSQWLRLLDEADAIRNFIKAHNSVLVDKAPAE